MGKLAASKLIGAEEGTSSNVEEVGNEEDGNGDDGRRLNATVVAEISRKGLEQI